MQEKSFVSPLRGKVIGAFILACVAIALAMATTYVSFDNLLIKVEELSVPNTKLRTLNSLFEQITRLDQQQRADAIKNPRKPYRTSLQESKMLIATLDSLINMSWGSSIQQDRLQAMKRIISKRDYLLIDYLKLRSDFASNKSLSHQLDSLSEVLMSSKPQSDSSIITSQTKTTTTTILPEEKKRNFFSRIFSKKKKDSLENKRVEVKEETSVRVDTLSIAQQDKAIAEVGLIIKKLDEDQRMQTREILGRELNLVNTNLALINQLLSILQEVEADEMTLVENKNAEAANVVSSSIERITIIIIIFFLLAAGLVFLILMDISKSNYYRLQLIQAKEEAEQLGHVKQRFLANMSHEIRTPLQSIVGFIEQLKANNTSDEVLHAIRHSSEHLLHIVDEVLDFSRIESGKFVLSRESFSMNQLLEEVSSVVKIQAQQKSLSFTIEKLNEDERVLGDSFRLRQILYNLLSNAIKFTTTGSVKLGCYRIAEKDDQITFQFEIADTGKGIPPSDQERIFKQFEQGAGNINRHYGGSGLGLSIVKRLIELQNGTIDLKSKPDEGSTFSITLTFEKDSGTTSVESSAPVLLPKSIGAIWVVDDDPLILKLCSLILKNHGVSHRTFQNPEEVLLEDRSTVKAIFLDIRMPQISGVDLCRKLKSETPQLIVIALTAHVLPAERKSIMDSGFDHILTKPFREQDFMSVLQLIPETQNIATAHEFDFRDLEKMTMGDPELLKSIVHEFEHETTQDLIKLEKRLLDKDAAGTREVIHQLAGRIGQMGAHALSLRLKRLEQQLVAGKNLSELPEISSVPLEVKSLLKELPKKLSLAIS